MAATTAAAITFPGGRGWAAEPKMSALISVRLGLVSQCRSCLPSAESTHSTQGRRRIVPGARTHHTHHTRSLRTHTHTPNFTLSPPPHTCIVPLSLPPQPFNHPNVALPFFFSSLPTPSPTRRKMKKKENKAPPPSKQDVFFSFLRLVLWRARFKH